MFLPLLYIIRHRLYSLCHALFPLWKEHILSRWIAMEPQQLLWWNLALALANRATNNAMLAMLLSVRRKSTNVCQVGGVLVVLLSVKHI